MSWEKQASVAPAGTHQVEEILPRVLQEVSQEAALHRESISKLSPVAITARSKVGEQGFVQKGSVYCKHDKRGWKAPLITD